jgi:hypothetical protein
MERDNEREIERGANPFIVFGIVVIVVFLSAVFTGCAGARKLDENDKLFYMAHAVDVAQTLQISHSTCHIEIGVDEFIGKRPNSDEVLMWGLTMAAGYYLVEDYFPDWAKYFNVSYRAYTVNKNYSNGLTVGSYSCDTMRYGRGY